ncbi:hypothetical protein [Phycicoccus sp. Soil748]|uniref:hypothetical protein n=1 Tax=Phycicoccus sp. Soil748 TaxID=1736397 RepID=UPI0007037D61|nr:hypothetical protein [Phycicoccus sp. Soil748]KRE56426.1 hypothetical protein ASG70_04730 [Phycicoccus sp. Soil748]
MAGTVRATARRALAIVAILVGLTAGMAGAASAAPSIPGVPDCKDAPTAQLPGGGITGFLDPGPTTAPEPRDPFVDNPQTSVYEQYGYAGLGWHSYDLGCGGGVRDIDASIDTATGNFLISAATWGAAASNGLHNKVAHPDQYMAPLDDVVTAVTQRLHDSIWSPWGATALVGVGVLLLLYSMQGRLSSAASAGAWALLVLAIVAGIGQYPSRVASFFDDTVSTSVSSISAGVSGLTNLPATSDPARAQGALVVDRVLYDNWLRGELGATDSPAAKRWGPALFKASAFTWAEAKQAEQDPEAGKRIAEKKQETWKKTAAEIQDKDPVAYGYLQGKSGGRAGTGVMVALGSTFTLLFRLVADIFLFAGLVMLRLLVMMFPAIAVVGVMAPMASIVRRVFAMGGAAVVNVIAFSAGSAVHATIISAVLTRSTTTGMGVLGIVLCLVTTVVAFIVLYPLLSFTSILGQSGGPRWLKRGGSEVWRYTSSRLATKNAMKDADHELAEERQAPDHGAGPLPAMATTGFRYRMSHLPSEAFGRPDHSPIRERQLSSPYAQRPSLAAVEAPRIDSSRSHAHEDRAVSVGADHRHPSKDPAYALAASAREANPDLTPPANSPGRALSGVLVDEIPADARELPTYAHDSHTEIRPDGVGPRVYDPDTKRTVLALQERPEG